MPGSEEDTAPPEGPGSAAVEASPRKAPARTPTPLADFDPLVGATVADRYRIVRRIGEGGMGAVYEGQHTVLGRPVAVKVLLEKFHEKTELVARLLQEARLASAIGHENIIDVTDFGTTTDGRAFVVMEFLEGESLAQVVMRDAPLPVERCLRIARQVASALSAAHQKGIVHRDIKPENVFLLRRGEQDFVKVVDFGISKAVKSREDGADLLRLTRTGMVLGTPLYMSPEQARGGDDVDARVDIWAIGVMLYECLTGEVPFRANNYLGVISQVLTQDVLPPSKLRPELGIPAAVEAVVMRAMEKDRTRRYQDMADLERDLGRLLAGDPNVGMVEATSPEIPVPPVRARWHLGIAAVTIVGVGLALTLARTEREARRTRAAAAKAAAAASAEASAPSAVAPGSKAGAPGPDDEATGSAAAAANAPESLPSAGAGLPAPSSPTRPPPMAKAAGVAATPAAKLPSSPTSGARKSNDHERTAERRPPRPVKPRGESGPSRPLSSSGQTVPGGGDLVPRDNPYSEDGNKGRPAPPEKRQSAGAAEPAPAGRQW